MNDKTYNSIKTEEFVKKFPKQVKELGLAEHFGHLPKISYRTFRYYITKGLMPRPQIIDRKSCYFDTPDSYKRLFIIWHLIHFKRRDTEQVKTILKSYKSEEELECLILFLINDNFLDDIVLTGSVENTIERIRQDKVVSPKRSFLFKTLIYLLGKDFNNEKEEVDTLISDLKTYKVLGFAHFDGIREKKLEYSKLRNEIENFKNKIDKSLKYFEYFEKKKLKHHL